jgi:hypothetical protein
MAASTPGAPAPPAARPAPLPEVHMVVGVDVLVLAPPVTEAFQGQIGDDLVGVLSTAAGGRVKTDR